MKNKFINLKLKKNMPIFAFCGMIIPLFSLSGNFLTIVPKRELIDKYREMDLQLFEAVKNKLEQKAFIQNADSIQKILNDFDPKLGLTQTIEWIKNRINVDLKSFENKIKSIKFLKSDIKNKIKIKLKLGLLQTQEFDISIFSFKEDLEKFNDLILSDIKTQELKLLNIGNQEQKNLGIDNISLSDGVTVSYEIITNDEGLLTVEVILKKLSISDKAMDKKRIKIMFEYDLRIYNEQIEKFFSVIKNSKKTKSELFNQIGKNKTASDLGIDEIQGLKMPNFITSSYELFQFTQDAKKIFASFILKSQYQEEKIYNFDIKPKIESFDFSSYLKSIPNSIKSTKSRIQLDKISFGTKFPEDLGIKKFQFNNGIIVIYNFEKTIINNKLLFSLKIILSKGKHNPIFKIINIIPSFEFEDYFKKIKYPIISNKSKEELEKLIQKDTNIQELGITLPNDNNMFSKISLKIIQKKDKKFELEIILAKNGKTSKKIFILKPKYNFDEEKLFFIQSHSKIIKSTKLTKFLKKLKLNSELSYQELGIPEVVLAEGIKTFYKIKSWQNGLLKVEVIFKKGNYKSSIPVFSISPLDLKVSKIIPNSKSLIKKNTNTPNPSIKKPDTKKNTNTPNPSIKKNLILKNYHERL